MSDTKEKDVLLNSDGFYRPLRLLVCNYIVQFRQHTTTGAFFVMPHANYSSQWGTPPYGLTTEEQNQWGSQGWFIGDVSDCSQKLDADFETMAGKGFNAVRVCGIAPAIKDGALSLPVASDNPVSFADYLSLLDGLLGVLDARGLKAILLVGAGSDQWGSSALYRDYLRNLCTHLKDNPAVLAYDLYNEPAWGYPQVAGLDKYRTAHWVADSVWTIRRHAPHHLVTIGLSHPDTVFAWDPALLPVDFVSYHFYSLTKNFPDSPDRIASMLYWAGKTSTKPWIIGETGYSGTDGPSTGSMTGTTAEQQTYAELTLQRSLDCGCMGYSWWQYQDVHWWSDEENFLGLVSWTTPNDPANSELHKPALDSFAAYHSMIADESNCAKPPGYTNAGNHPVELTGKVVDHWGNALPNAVIVGWKQVIDSASPIANIVTGLPTTIELQGQYDLKAGNFVMLWGITGTLGGLLNGERQVSQVSGNTGATYVEINVDTTGESYSPGGWLSRVGYPSFLTYSEDDGTFALGASSPGSPLYRLRVSYPGYTLIDAPAADGLTYQLEPVKYNGWSKRWTNDGDGTIGTWNIGALDRFYVGDFDGDGADELLCAQTGGGADLLTLFRFEDGVWQVLWSNGGDPAAGDGIYPYRHNFVVGDFDGDGKDELLGNDTPSGWMTLFEFYGGDWHWRWSDGGDPNEQLRLYRDNLTVGDFDGSGRDDLLGRSGWTTWFAFDPAGNKWTWVDSNYGKVNDLTAPMSYIHPYSPGVFAAGDFDGDGRDELLAENGNWVTLFRVGNTGRFEWMVSDYGRSLGPMNLMHSYRQRYVVGDFDGDGKEEVLGCADWLTMFEFVSGNFRCAWSTFNDARVADLKPDPGTTQFAAGTGLFSFRASPYVPPYLMAIRDPGGASLAVLLAYDPGE